MEKVHWEHNINNTAEKKTFHFFKITVIVIKCKKINHSENRRITKAIKFWKQDYIPIWIVVFIILLWYIHCIFSAGQNSVIPSWACLRTESACSDSLCLSRAKSKELVGCELMPVSPVIIKDSKMNYMEMKWHENDEQHMFDTPLISIASVGV